jgi:hypothetical protein
MCTCAELCRGRQVTNPPIDPLREGLVMSLAVRLGKRGNLLEPGPGAYSQARARSQPPSRRGCVCPPKHLRQCALAHLCPSALTVDAAQMMRAA